jgi:hypothetical protein
MGTALLLTSTGCIEPSLNPLFTPDDARADVRLEGTWACNDSGTRTWTLEKKNDTEHDKAFIFYRIAIQDEDRSRDVVAILGRLGDRDFMTFAADDDPPGLPSFVRRQYLGVNTFGRITIDRDRLQISMMPAEWGDKHKNDVLYGLGALQGEHGFVLTAPTAALQAMVLAHDGDEGAFLEAVTLVRPGKTGGKCYSE